MSSKVFLVFPFIFSSLTMGPAFAGSGAEKRDGTPLQDDKNGASFEYRIPTKLDHQSSVERSAGINTSVIMYHNDLQRTGQNLTETTLTRSNVNKNSFGKIGAFPATGLVYGQPLVDAVTIPSAGNPQRTVTHNLVFFGTLHDQVYAYDADTLSTTPVWKRDFLNDQNIPARAQFPCPNSPCVTWDYHQMVVPNISPELGIVATPVIDDAAQAIYFTVATLENGNPVWRIHKLSLVDGSELGNKIISGSVPGNGSGSVSGSIAFSPINQLSRAALTLDHGRLYIAFTSFDDQEPCHGWVFAYDPSTLSQMGAWITTPNSGIGTIWQAGGGPAVDAAGNLFFSTGNGDSDFVYTAGAEFGDSVVKLNFDPINKFHVSDWFTPYNHADLDLSDVELGSGGVLMLPDQTGTTNPHLMVTAGKEGRVYLLDRDNMGHLGTDNGSGVDAQAVDELVNKIPGGQDFTGVFGTPAYFGNAIFIAANHNSLHRIPINTSTGTAKLDWTNRSYTNKYISQRGATPSISANGTSDGIVWYLDASAYTYSWNGTPGGIGVTAVPAPANTLTDGPTVLYAYSTDNLGAAQPLYSSNMVPADAAGNAVKFAVPTVANGMVFVGTDTEVSVYGLGTLQANGIQDIKDKAAKVDLFPVPASSVLNIQAPNLELGSEQLRIVDMLGRVVHEEKIDLGNAAKVQVDVSTLEMGEYVVTLTSELDGSSISKPFIVKR